MSSNTSVSITGLGLEIPGIVGIESFLPAIYSRINRSEFCPEQKIGRKGLRYKDRATQMALCAAQSALQDAQLPLSPAEQVSPESFGVIVSSNLSNIDTVCRVVDTLRASGVNETSPMDLPNASSNIVAASIAIRFGMKAMNLMLCNGATSGIDSLYLASNIILSGRAQRMLVVGVETLNDNVSKLMNESSVALSKSSNEVQLGDCSGAVLLESADAAAERKAKTYATIDGYCYNSECDLKETILKATNKYKVSPDLWLVPNCYYLSTAREVESARNLWASNPPFEVIDLGLSLGETYGALGVLQCILASLWLQTHSAQLVVATNGACWDDGISSIIVRKQGA